MAPLERTAQQVLDTLAAEPSGLTRNDLILRTRLSRPTLFGAVRKLISEGVVDEAADMAAGGRRLFLARPAGLVVGLDLGRDHLRGRVADLSGNPVGDVVDRDENVDGAGPGVLMSAAELVADVLESADADIGEVRAVAMGVPARLNADGQVMSNQALFGWGGVDIDELLHDCLVARFGGQAQDLPVVIANDANLGALGEQLHGAAIGLDDFAYIKVSTGVGAGLVLGGRLHIGHSRGAGEFGHISIPPEAEERIARNQPLVLPRIACERCGRLNCLENLASCTAIVRQIVATDPTQTGLDIGTVTERVRRADSPIAHPLERTAVINAGIRLGYCIADLVRLVDPQHAVLGGRLADAEDLLRDTVADTVQRALGGAWDGEIRLVERDRIVRSEVEGAVALAVLQVMSRVAGP